MIRIDDDRLVFDFSQVHPGAVLKVRFQRTLRIPDDGRDHFLPPGLGDFPLRIVDDPALRAPPRWLERGGVALPMYRSEAMWIDFESEWVPSRATSYPFAVKIAAGRINAVSGARWRRGLQRKPRQGYVVVPDQPWLDGYCVEEGLIRQFVAMPLGAGYSAEEQLTGEAEHGGLQIEAYPMKREQFERRFSEHDPRERYRRQSIEEEVPCCCSAPNDMGLAAGGRMRQEIYEDEHGHRVWDRKHRAACFVQLADSLVWSQIAGEQPPTAPPTARDYSEAGLPWFDYYDESSSAVLGSDELKKLKSVVELDAEKGNVSLPENQSVDPRRIVELRRGMRSDQVREGVG
jgi:hypothetical protein